MKLSSKNKILIGIGVFVSAFIITNPSPTAFKDHLGKTSYSGLIREHNYFVFSTYLDSSYDEENDVHHEQRYVAVVGNFWSQPQSPQIQLSKEDLEPKKLSINQFAAKIKSKYPEYDNVDNKILVEKILKKYPVYINKVDTTGFN